MPAREPSFGTILRRARHGAGLSQAGLSERSGIPKPRISQYENDRLRPSLETLGKLAEALEVPAGSLVPGPRHPALAFVERLAERGVRIRTRAEGERMADFLADRLREDPRAGQG